jgi:hypothetical protein
VRVTPEVLVAALEQHCGVRRTSAMASVMASFQSSLRRGAESAGVVSPPSGVDDEVAAAVQHGRCPVGGGPVAAKRGATHGRLRGSCGGRRTMGDGRRQGRQCLAGGLGRARPFVLTV